MRKNETVYYPQDEMLTPLIPITSGCKYNRCLFCSMYENGGYREIPLHDIDTELLNAYKYTEKIFLTGADPLAVGFERLLKILLLIKKRLPYCACVASYAAVRSIMLYTEEELSILHDNGLRLLYVGFESGSDEVLSFMKKGHNVEMAIEQGRKLNLVKLSFNAIIMTGIAGKGRCIDNALKTAKMLNQMELNKIISMNLRVFEFSKLNKYIKNGEFSLPGMNERIMELRTVIENFIPKKKTFLDTTHPTNIVSVKGYLPDEKDEIINKISSYIK